MKIISNIVAAALLCASAFAAETFVVDKAHSEANFQVRHLVSRVSGKFDDFAGSITVDREKPVASAVEFTIKDKPKAEAESFIIISAQLVPQGSPA